MKKLATIIILINLSCAPTLVREGRKLKYPEAFRYDLKQAKKLIKAEKYTESIKALEKMVALYEGKTDISPAIYYIGFCYMKLKGYDVAEKYFQRILEEYPDSNFRWRASLFLYRIYSNRHDTIKAIYYLRDAVENGASEKNLSYLYFQLGQLEMETGEKLQAFNDFVYSFLTAKNNTLRTLARSTALRIFRKYLPEEVKEKLDYSALPSFIRAEWLREKIKETGKMEKESIEVMIKAEEYPEEFARLKELAESKRKLSPTKIGVLLPLSGKYSEAGIRILEGLQMGLGIPDGDPSFTLVVRDIGEGVERFIFFLREIIKKEEVGIIIGPPSTFLTKKASPYVSAAEIPFISFSPDSEITKLSPFILRFFINKRSQIKDLVEYAFENLGIKKFAILYPTEKFGFDCMNYFWDTVLTGGGEIRGVEGYKPRATDFSVQLKKMLGLFYLEAREEYLAWERKPEAEKDEEPEVPPVQDFSAIFLPDTLKILLYLIPQLEYHDADIRNLIFLGTYLWNTEEIKEIPSTVKVSVFFPVAFNPYSEREEVKKFIEEFSTLYDHPPDVFSAFAYDLGSILYKLFKDSGKMRGKDIVKKLLSVKNYHGVNKNITFLPDGDIVHENIILNAASL